MSAGSTSLQPNAAGAVQVTVLEPVAAAAPPVAAPKSFPSFSPLLEAVIRESTEAADAEGLTRFLDAESLPEALAAWLTSVDVDPAQVTMAQVAKHLNRTIAQIDDLLTRQVNAILHHPQFQKLEASWRGLSYLVDQTSGTENVKVRLLDASWKDLARDAERALEFDQSQFFKKVYSEEFDTPGGEPYGMLLGDFEIHPKPSPDHPFDDISILTSLTQTAAAAFAPLVTSAHPSLFGLDSFESLERPLNFSRNFEQLEFLKWRAFRDTEDARFCGQVLPRVLMRLPYEDTGERVDRFRFREEVEGPDRSKYLWGNAIYAFGAVVARAYAQTGWLADIRGVQRGVLGAGLVSGLPVHSFSTDRRGIAPKFSSEVIVTDEQEKELSDLGFIPLCHCFDTEYSAFYGTQSVQKPKKYDTLPATTNAKISAMLQYILCVSRFAHYIKVIGREKVGSFAEPEECEAFMHNWLYRYVTSDEQASAETRARFPLREGRVEVKDRPGKPGHYRCTIHLRPHYQLDDMVAAVRLVTELAPAKA